MNSSVSVSIRKLSKEFKAGKNRSTLYKTLIYSVLGFKDDQIRIKALEDLSFDLKRGEWLGVVGNNGSGKSTLLKIIAGLYKPTRGTVSTSGSVSLFTGMALGMLEDLSVRENIYLYGAIYGMDKTEIEKGLNEMIEWAVIEDFVDSELKTLSSGMKSRLSFSVARYFKSDIKLIDEALSAGDKDFKSKCADYFENIRVDGNTYIICSHDLNFIAKFCDKVLWLHKGVQMNFGLAEFVLEKYGDFHSKK